MRFYTEIGDYQHAEKLTQENIATFKENHLEKVYDFGLLIKNYSSLCRKLGKYEKAAALLDRSLSFYKTRYPHTPEVSINLIQQGKLLRKTGLYIDSYNKFEESKKKSMKFMD